MAKLAGKSGMEIWGTGTPMREFLHVDDLAHVCVFLMKTYSGDGHVNVGSGDEVSIADLARFMLAVVGLGGAAGVRHEQARWDTAHIDGQQPAVLDRWKPTVGLPEGIRQAYAWYLDDKN
ncbi:NAD-dependent epimerase/dehydratase family protein [Sphingomonas oligophenolica]|uniref:NAD-dependent epimerase/dehydratase family protein n=1 Tax=Sphingomonas oligophenolica TaxID=301154 RepID=A0ABU9YCS2_9SPHN